jgi:glutamine amidotransferase
MAVEPSLFDDIAGSTDSEALFYLALTFGLEDDPVGGLERAVGFVEATAAKHGIEDPIQMTVGISNGERLWAVRYSSQHQSRTLYVSEQAATLRRLHPDNPRLQQFTDEDRVVVSEPPGDLPGAWLAIPESTALIIQPGADEQRSFQPHWP